MALRIAGFAGLGRTAHNVWIFVLAEGLSLVLLGGFAIAMRLCSEFCLWCCWDGSLS
jgi:hypothetical protein